jgi:hypothetical protein
MSEGALYGVGCRVLGARCRVLDEHRTSLEHFLPEMYRGVSLIRNSAPVGPYSRTTPMAVSYERGTPVKASHQTLRFARRQHA